MEKTMDQMTSDQGFPAEDRDRLRAKAVAELEGAEQARTETLPIPRALREQEQLIEVLSKHLAELEDRIFPVLQPDHAGEPMPDDDDHQPRSDMAELLTERNTRIVRLIRRVESMFNRVEL